MGQSLTTEENQEIQSRMASIIARKADTEYMRVEVPDVNKIPLQTEGATPQMRQALEEMPGSNSKAEYLAKWNQVSDVRLSNKKQVDTRTEWEKFKAKAAELRGDWKNDFISKKNWDRDGYEANIPVFRDGKLYSKITGELWTQKDWNNLHSKYGQPKHYVPENKGV